MTTRLPFSCMHAARPRTAGAEGLSRFLLAMAIMLLALPAMIPPSIAACGAVRGIDDRIVSQLHANADGVNAAVEACMVAVVEAGHEWHSCEREPQPEPDQEDDSAVAALLGESPIWLRLPKRHGSRHGPSMVERRLWCKAHAVRAPPM